MMSQSVFWNIQDEAAKRAAAYGMNPYVIFDDPEIDGYKYEVPFPFIGGYDPPGWEALRDEDGDLRFFQTDIAMRGPGLDHPFSSTFRYKIRQYEKEAEEKGETYGYAVIEAGEFQFVVGVFRKTGEPTVEGPDEDAISKMQYERQLELIEDGLGRWVDSSFTAAPTPEGEDAWPVKVWKWLWEHDQMALELDTNGREMPGFTNRRALRALVNLNLLEEDSDLILRDVDIDGYRLQLWDCEEREYPNPHSWVFYRLTHPDGRVIFESYQGALCLDDDDTVRSIISTCTLRKGDVDGDFFRWYTDEQKDWRDTEAEDLSIWGIEPDDDEFEYDANFQMYEVDGEMTRFKPWGSITCEFCGKTAVPEGVLKADPDQRVCAECCADGRVPTNKEKTDV